MTVNVIAALITAIAFAMSFGKWSSIIIFLGHITLQKSNKAHLSRLEVGIFSPLPFIPNGYSQHCKSGHVT